MLYRLADSALIVDPDIGYSFYIRPYIYEYQRHLAVTKVFEMPRRLPLTAIRRPCRNTKT